MNTPRTDIEFPKLTWEDKQWVLESFAQQLESDLIQSEKQRNRLAAAMAEMWPFIEEDYYPNCVTAIFDSAVKKYKAALDSVKGGQK